MTITQRHVSFATAALAIGLVAVATFHPDPAFAQSSGAATRVQSRLLSVGTDVGTVIRNVIWGGAVIAAIVAVGAMVMGKIDVKRFITIGVACVLLGVIGGIVSVFTGGGEGGAGVSVENFDDGGSLNDSFGN